MSDRDDKDLSQTDVTVMRTDPSVSKSWSSETGSGEADAPRVLKQRFVLEEKLGSGGMGSVFRAKDLRKVEARDRQPFLAVKILNNDFREHPEAFVALQREATKSQTLSHSNIVSIYDYDKDGDVPFITMELLEGQELAELLRAYPNGLPDPMAWQVIEGICAGLNHAHEAGIVHADFKPGNVFVSPKNDPKILDFGIARAVQLTETVGEDTLFDPARLAALTPAYASREMLNGDNPEPRDDLYSLGIVIYLILTGHHPYGRLSADDAAREGVLPEKPRRLSRRQWRVVRRCLAFNRPDRPLDMSEVNQFLFSPSPWRSRSAIAAAAAFMLALGVNLLVGEAELSDVKQEVRHNTLIDAQVARLSALLEAPQFDENWQSQVDDELATLRGLDEADSVVSTLEARIREAYTNRIGTTADVDVAIGLLDDGARYGELPEATVAVTELAFARVVKLLDASEPDEIWQGQVEAELDRLRRLFPGNPYLAELELELGDVLEKAVADSVARNEPQVASALLEELEEVTFDRTTVDQARALVGQASERFAAQERDRQRQERDRQIGGDLDVALALSCLRLDVARIADLAEKLAGSELAESKRQAIDAKLGDCIRQLAELDPDRALALQAQAKNRFGDSLTAASARVLDPCGLSYLVGNGAQGGRGGYCADELDGGQAGPRLVVVPAVAGEGRYAMTKYEVTWEHFRQFCAGRSDCDVEFDDEQLPVTGITIAMAQAYADWLSGLTGFHYRLPTSAEWAWAARGTPDPNRNCRVQLEGVQRGMAPVAATTGQSNEFGLLHMLGNVQEWVVDPEGIRAVGGTFADPIGDCVAQTSRFHGGEADTGTGFRLVREIS